MARFLSSFAIFAMLAVAATAFDFDVLDIDSAAGRGLLAGSGDQYVIKLKIEAANLVDAQALGPKIKTEIVKATKLADSAVDVTITNAARKLLASQFQVDNMGTHTRVVIS